MLYLNEKICDKSEDFCATDLHNSPDSTKKLNPLMAK
jgi:hypothetical protein